MTQIQLIDLCSRVPYHPKGHVVSTYNGAECDEWLTCATFPMFTSITNSSRLYLRPMSSMTEEEYESVSWGGCSHTYNYSSKSGFHFVEIKTFTLNILNWLNAHHFDYRGLIEKGLAISTEKYNPYEKV